MERWNLIDDNFYSDESSTPDECESHKGEGNLKVLHNHPSLNGKGELFNKTFICCNRSVLGLIFGLSLISSTFDALIFRPATGSTKYFSVWSADLLPKSYVTAGTVLTYQGTSFQMIQNSQVKEDVIGSGMVQYFFAGLGIHPRWFEFSVELPVLWNADFTDPQVFQAPTENITAFGDLRLYGKTNVVKGFSLMPFLVLPTGTPENFLGSDTFSGGVYGLFEKSFSRVSVAANLGFYFRETGRLRNIQAGHQVFYGMGVAYRVVREVFMDLELTGRTRLQSPFDKKVDNPAEILGGLHFMSPSERLRVDLGGGAGLIRGTGIPEFRILLGLVLKGR